MTTLKYDLNQLVLCHPAFSQEELLACLSHCETDDEVKHLMDWHFSLTRSVRLRFERTLKAVLRDYKRLKIKEKKRIRK